jgi:hypothetical protein
VGGSSGGPLLARELPRPSGSEIVGWEKASFALQGAGPRRKIGSACRVLDPDGRSKHWPISKPLSPVFSEPGQRWLGNSIASIDLRYG